MTTTILTGDCRRLLRELPSASVHCVVTSPPYFGLRDYGVCGQIGLEDSLAEFIAEMVAVFREVRRVLRDDGTCWLNLGDSYGGACCSPQSSSGEMADRSISTFRVRGPQAAFRKQDSIKPTDLMGVPWRVAFALQDDGWYLRRDIVWSKPNAMPESVTNRPATAHEYVFLLTKSADPLFWMHRDGKGVRQRPLPDYRWVHRETGEEVSVPPQEWLMTGRQEWRRINLWSGASYFYDGEAVREDRTSDEDAREFRGGCYVGGASDNGALGKRAVVGNRRVKVPGGWDQGGGGHGTIHREGRTSSTYQDAEIKSGRNLRSVWTIATAPFSDGHFATFPPRLAQICILAGTSARGACAACGAPWARVTMKGEADVAHQMACGADAAGEYHGQSIKDHDAAGVQNASDVKRRILEGMRQKTYDWRPTCDCPPADPVPCVVLDPFGGAGTVGLVTDRLQRDAILIELNPSYVAMAENRIHSDAGFLADIKRSIA